MAAHSATGRSFSASLTTGFGAIGVCLARSGTDPLPYLARAIAAEGQNSTSVFACGLTRTHAAPAELWRSACATFAAADNAHRNPGVLAGVIAGAARHDRALVEAWLDAAVTDPLLGEHLVVLQLAIPLDAAAMTRFRRSLVHGAAPSWRFSLLQIGGVTKPIPGAALADFLVELFEAEGGVLPALQILHMRIFGDRSDKRDVDTALIALVRRFLADPRSFAEKNANADHVIETIAKVALAGEGAAETATAICRALRGDALRICPSTGVLHLCCMESPRQHENRRKSAELRGMRQNSPREGLSRS